ncbi:hypothetical protein PVT67_12365 [Gallaecimonas kandeliae]|uniref:hypothetical protein n=1 Tax=Gallaecimonas kandeliae TaxID=3029055 RepID=UPI002648EFBA|nr:hypothetical protein [Gallaecimonas kandeliae]WKE64467.1 hypothetical protein PVT67_12365 [Gallaecimonas kandeliae]
MWFRLGFHLALQDAESSGQGGIDAARFARCKAVLCPLAGLRLHRHISPVFDRAFSSMRFCIALQKGLLPLHCQTKGRASWRVSWAKSVLPIVPPRFNKPYFE